MQRYKYPYFRRLCVRKMKSKKWFRRRNKRSLHLNINRIHHTLITHEICGIKPIPKPCGKIFEIIHITKELPRKFGDMSHCFGLGVMVFDGTKLIRVNKFISWFGRDKIRFGCFKRHYNNLRPII